MNIGNALYSAGKFKEAVTEYQRVISDYPKTDSVPAAYYKLGLTYNQLKQPDLARKAFEAVMQGTRALPRQRSPSRRSIDSGNSPHPAAVWFPVRQFPDCWPTGYW